MELEDAALAGAATGDAELDYGFGFDAGVGLAWWLGPGLALDLRALYLLQYFDEAEGQVSSGTIDDSVYAPIFSLSLGLTWVLGKPGGDP
jgi:hypothetical protein